MPLITRSIVRPVVLVVAVAFLLLSAASNTPVQAAGSCPVSARSLRTVQAASSIYYAPTFAARTSYQLAAGKRFFVCNDTAVAGWTAFWLANGVPVVYVPTGTFN